MLPVTVSRSSCQRAAVGRVRVVLGRLFVLSIIAPYHARPPLLSYRCPGLIVPAAPILPHTLRPTLVPVHRVVIPVHLEHTDHTHYSNESRSRSPGGGRRRTRRARSTYSDREVSPGGHRRPRRRSASYSDGARSPGRRRRPRRRGTELRESDPRRTEVPETHIMTVSSDRDYSEHAPW
ncbi:hypothetical protein B0H11DRAFT_434592 [Mycena galericulata]|nr:hypothetical protein B0H11DRAFT_434592 [Mycena galericulata]